MIWKLIKRTKNEGFFSMVSKFLKPKKKINFVIKYKKVNL